MRFSNKNSNIYNLIKICIVSDKFWHSFTENYFETFNGKIYFEVDYNQFDLQNEKNLQKKNRRISMDSHLNYLRKEEMRM